MFCAPSPWFARETGGGGMHCKYRSWGASAPGYAMSTTSSRHSTTCSTYLSRTSGLVTKRSRLPATAWRRTGSRRAPSLLAFSHRILVSIRRSASRLHAVHLQSNALELVDHHQPRWCVERWAQDQREVQEAQHRSGGRLRARALPRDSDLSDVILNFARWDLQREEEWKSP